MLRVCVVQHCMEIKLENRIQFSHQTTETHHQTITWTIELPESGFSPEDGTFTSCSPPLRLNPVVSRRCGNNNKVFRCPYF